MTSHSEGYIEESAAPDHATRAYSSPTPQEIAAAIVSMTFMADRYPTKGTVASRVFYLHFQVQTEGGKMFNGRLPDISSPAGGTMEGDLYTNNIDRLYRDTVDFEFQSNSIYTSLLFFDYRGHLLGHFKGSPLLSHGGIGVGTGKWS